MVYVMDNVISATDTYLSLLLSLPKISALTVFSSFLLIVGRILPIMALAPFFGSKSIPHPVKIMFSICICTIFLPSILVNLKQTEIPFNYLFIGFMLKELIIGFILGYLVAIPFYIAQSSGTLIDHIRGSSALQVTDPTTQTQTGPIGIFYNYTLIAIFFLIGGPFLFIDALGTSFELIPINGFFNPNFFSNKVPFWHDMITLLNYIFSMSIQLGAPSIIGILMAEMFLGIANRLAPQVQIVFLGISLKSWVGLAILAVAWVFIINQLGKESLSWIKSITQVIKQAALK